MSCRASSGFKLNVKNLRSLSLNLGEHTTSPSAAIGVSIDGAGFFSVNASVGTNVIPIATPLPSVQASSSIVRINVEGWQDNRINLESITLNSVMVLSYRHIAPPNPKSLFLFRMPPCYHTLLPD